MIARIWECFPRVFSFFPTIEAVSPPIFASISSKMRVGREPFSARRILRAKRKRAISPPLLRVEIEAGSSPGFAARKKEIWSFPVGPTSLESTAINTLAWGKLREMSSAVSLLSSCLAVFMR